jgi:CheY-like chemotaxis protein/MinD-like ATPase involved in chromosome partitioning or flagellar assembly
MMKFPVGENMPSKILIVDDDKDSLKLIGLMLQRQGYEVATAESGTQALQAAVDEDPDLIILDVMMPGMDGYTVCRNLRNDQRTVDTPILMFTAKTLVDDKVAGFEAGADDYLTKPTHPAELAARVQAILARSSARGAESTTVSSQNITYGFLSAKGGVGLSTLVTNIATIIAGEEATSVVDFRLGRGTIGLSLGFPQATSLANVLAKPPNEITPQLIEEELIADEKSGLYLLPASPRSRESQVRVSLDAARAVVNGLSRLSPNVLIDLGPGLNPVTMTLAREVTRVVLAVEANRISLQMGRDILNELRQAGVVRNKTSIVIINRAESNLQIPWQDAEQFLQNEIDAVISPAPELMFQSIEARKPVVLHQPDAVVSGQYNKLAQELVRRSQVEMG